MSDERINSRAGPMALLRIVPLAVILVLGTAILYASSRADIAESFSRMVADPWGMVTLIDLYGGFAIVLVVVGLLEPNRWITLAAVVLTPFLGSLVPAAWLLLRFRLLLGRGP